ncbi:DUF6635 family protein [Paracoccus sp. MBLB3053]|uniref:DUF6635 family protein n=1 Tax=Paracoccus aurantius TaxID=3073814 RepID=A0ABU2HWI0_9RHOB|nr:DUF6635 family protein [Paracoccus sp. MBLB3053]MDS9469082.1 DUF6635 family protein [Paracoccus sp. MBLB3053]
MTLAPADPRPMTLREREVKRFVRRRYGLRGTFDLHRAAIGYDLLRAPLNVTLAPIFLLIRLTSVLLRWIGARRASVWLGSRRIFLTSDLARQLDADLNGLMRHLEVIGAAPHATDAAVQRAIANHTETRNAVAEITTSILVLLAGLFLFERATPGVISLAAPIAEFQVRSEAIGNFVLGDWMGRQWYRMFPAEIPTGRLILTGIALSIAASIVTTFAGLIADPIQLMLGTHRRRLMRMLGRLDRHDGGGLEPEHVLARIGDLGDLASTLWRALR